MTIQVEVSAETQAWLAAQAAERSMELPAYAAALLEQAANPAVLEPGNESALPDQQRTSARRSLAQLFSESPFKGLDIEFERDADFGRDTALGTASCLTPTSLRN